MSVPRVAYFYWTGGPLPWLRAQSMVTFQRHHPDWQVVLGSPEARADVPPGVSVELDRLTDPSLPPASRSDVWRWHVLQRGGLYADTDVLFLRSLELLLEGDCDAWLTTDGGHVIPGGKRGWKVVNGRKCLVSDGLSIGVLAARRGSALFARAAAEVAGMKSGHDYQSHGTSMLARRWPALSRGLKVGNLPYRLFYAGSGETDVRTLWKPFTRPHSSAVAVHWYGGSPESAPYLRARSADDLPDCAVRACLS